MSHLLETCKTFLCTSHQKRLFRLQRKYENPEGKILKFLLSLMNGKRSCCFCRRPCRFLWLVLPEALDLLKTSLKRRNDLALSMSSFFVAILVRFRFSHGLPQQFMLTAMLRLFLLISSTRIWIKFLQWSLPV